MGKEMENQKDSKFYINEDDIKKIQNEIVKIKRYFKFTTK